MRGPQAFPCPKQRLRSAATHREAERAQARIGILLQRAGNQLEAVKDLQRRSKRATTLLPRACSA